MEEVDRVYKVREKESEGIDLLELPRELRRFLEMRRDVFFFLFNLPTKKKKQICFI